LTSLRWFAVLQSLMAAGLVMVLWTLHARLGRRPFFLWWAWAWTLFAAHLLLGLLSLPLSAAWTPARVALVFLATLCGFLQPVLMVLGATTLRSASLPSRTLATIGIASACTGGMLIVAWSLTFPDPLDSFAGRLAPRALAAAGAAGFCVAALASARRETGPRGYGLAAVACLLYCVVQTLYGVAAIGRLTAGPAGPFAALFERDAALRPQLFLLDVVGAYGICLGMVLLLIEDFKRSTQALEDSLRLRREALDENAVLQAEISQRRRVERALRDSEDRYRDLVDHSEDLICTHDLDGHILTVNAAAARTLGYTPDELTRRTVQELLAQETRGRFDELLAAIKRDNVARGLLTVMTRGGEQRIWEFRNTLRTDGVPVPVVRGMARDVTEQVTAERARRLSDAKLLAAFRATPCAIAIASLEDTRVLEVNDTFEQLTGYHRGEIVGRTWLEHGLWADPDERTAVVADVKERGKVSNRDVRWRSKCGDELAILLSAVPMFEDGCMLVVALDITAHRQVEARHRAILRALPDWMFLVSSEGVFLDCHVKDRTFLLAQPEAFIGRTLAEVLPPELAENLSRLFARVARTDEPGTFEYVVPINGEARYYEARAVRCENDQILSIVRDVTEGKRAEHQARELRQELAHIGRITTLAALTGSLAHEIRQPLTAIRTNAQAAQRLLAQIPGLSELRSALADIVSDSQRAADVIQRVSGLLKRDSLLHAPIELNAAVEEIAEVLRTDLLARRISLKVELEPDLPLVVGDRVQLQQVALNLLMNACDAVEDQPDADRLVWLRTAVKGLWVTVSVSDHGAGLTDEEIDRAFEPFYTTKSTGMGLGLPICEMIMDVHEGTLRIDRNPGGGMTSSFGLLSASAVATAVGSAGALEHTATGGERLRPEARSRSLIAASGRHGLETVDSPLVKDDGSSDA
jgi:PAS domain S-box-containing protein